MPLLSPKLDIVFKKLFVTEPVLLLDLLQKIFSYYGEPIIQKITIRNPEILPEQEDDKKVILDILAEDEKGRQFDIEMQAQKHHSYPERTLYYLARLYGGQLRSGQQFQQLRPVVGIHFIDFILYELKQWHYCFEWRDRDAREICYSEHLKLFLFELPKIHAHANDLEQWLFFFNHPETENAMPYNNPMIQKAQATLEKLSEDKALARERIRYR